MPRFVLLRHECPTSFAKSSHWDFMLEADGVLMTWELRELPLAWGGTFGSKVNATRLSDHRLAYLDYEGPLSRNRGSVERVGSGIFEFMNQNEQSICAKLDSPTIRGTIELIQEGDNWTLKTADHDEA